MSPTGLASKANQCLHGETIWFAIRGNAPLWLLFKSLRRWVAFPLCLGLFLKAMISLLSPSPPTPGPGSLPIQTSPNCPAPSFFSSLRDSRGISQASFSHGFCGLGDTQGTVSFWQSPSLPSGTEPLVSRGQPALSQPEASPWRPPCLVHCIRPMFYQAAIIRDIPKRAGHNKMPPPPFCSIGLRFQENPKQPCLGKVRRAQQASEAATYP